MAFARSAAAIASDFAVFPSTEACLSGGARRRLRRLHLGHRQSQCRSVRARLADGDAAALDAAVAIRKLFDGRPLVSGVKTLLAHIHGDPALARVRPPLAPFLPPIAPPSPPATTQSGPKRVA